jgi:hypothetical protein
MLHSGRSFLQDCGRGGLRFRVMNLQHGWKRRASFLLAPEHGGDTVSGGGHPADAPLPASEPVDDTLAQDARSRGNTPGVGVPGSKTNPHPPSREEIARLAQGYWEEEGRPEGRAEEHWNRAEQTCGNSGAGRAEPPRARF